LGDFNSNASVAKRGLDFVTSVEGSEVMKRINTHSSGHVLALGAGEKTSIGGERFDEVIVHQSTLGRRHAHVFPPLGLVQPQMCRALPEAEQRQYKTATMGFGNIFSDHLLVYVDLEFSGLTQKDKKRKKRKNPDVIPRQKSPHCTRAARVR
jgi:hypothetical protein